MKIQGWILRFPTTFPNGMFAKKTTKFGRFKKEYYLTLLPGPCHGQNINNIIGKCKVTRKEKGLWLEGEVDKEHEIYFKEDILTHLGGFYNNIKVSKTKRLISCKLVYVMAMANYQTTKNNCRLEIVEENNEKNNIINSNN